MSALISYLNQDLIIPSSPSHSIKKKAAPFGSRLSILQSTAYRQLTHYLLQTQRYTLESLHCETLLYLAEVLSYSLAAILYEWLCI